MKKIILFPILVTIFLVGCEKEKIVSAERIQKEIENSLNSGSSVEAIEEFFESRDLPITYDEYTRTYRSLVKVGEESERKFTVKIFLNEQKQITSIEVRESFTFL